MKIAIFSDCYLDSTGGIVSTINAQKAELERRGHTVEVFSSAYPSSDRECKKWAAQHVFPVPSCRLIFRGVIPIARRPHIVEKWLLKSHPELKTYDVFYVHYEAGCSIAGLRLAKRLNIPSVQVMHGREDAGLEHLAPFGLRTVIGFGLNLFHSWYLPHPVKIARDDYLAKTFASAKMWTLMVNHANYADFVITPSRHFKEKLKHYGVTKDIKVLPNGLPDEIFAYIPTKRSYDPTREPLRIIWHSRVSSEKRTVNFLKALSKVHCDYHLDVYGAGMELARAKLFAARHKLKVVFHGNTPFKTFYPKIAESHLDVLVSYNYDTFGMTLIEAESAGTPVLFVDPDMQEILPRGGYILANNPSSTAIAEAIDYLATHPGKIATMSEIMLNHRDEVKVSRVVDHLIDILTKITKPNT